MNEICEYFDGDHDETNFEFNFVYNEPVELIVSMVLFNTWCNISLKKDLIKEAILSHFESKLGAFQIRFLIQAMGTAYIICTTHEDKTQKPFAFLLKPQVCKDELKQAEGPYGDLLQHLKARFGHFSAVPVKLK
jgi:hypothetical protein